MEFWKGLLFLGGFVATPLALATVLGGIKPVTDPKQVVRQFLEVVRSGLKPDAARDYFAAQVNAHQLTGENETVVQRTADDYAAHVRDFRRVYGEFTFEVTELLADGDRVYARWKQTGCHVGPIEGNPPSGLPVVEIGSAVYRVEAGRIVEYWIQLDRKGVELQFERNAAATGHKLRCVA